MEEEGEVVEVEVELVVVSPPLLVEDEEPVDCECARS